MISEKLLNKVFIYFILLLVSLTLLIFFIFVNDVELQNASYIKRPDKKEISLQIVSKALFLEPFKFDISIDSIKDMIEAQLAEKRPDAISKLQEFEIKFKKSLKVFRVKEDEKIYVKVDEKGYFDISDTKTPLSIFFAPLDKKRVKAVIETDLKDFAGLENSKTSSFVLDLTDFKSNLDIEKREDLKILLSSKWYSKDELQKVYKNQNANQLPERLEIGEKIVYLKNQDLLIYKDGSWQKPKSFENTQKFVIAKIKSADDKLLEMQIWDENSNKYVFAIPGVVKAGFSTRADQLITSVRKRTVTHLSCQIEKQRVILKEKDILIKKDGRWRLLKKDIDFDEIKNEELFYFDRIENKNNKNFFIGYLFNPMRTSSQKIETPIMTIDSQRINKKRIIR